MIHEDNKIINRDDKYTGKKQETEEKLRVLFIQREKKIMKKILTHLDKFPQTSDLRELNGNR